jgi:hypothetical protein
MEQVPKEKVQKLEDNLEIVKEQNKMIVSEVKEEDKVEEWVVKEETECKMNKYSKYL